MANEVSKIYSNIAELLNLAQGMYSFYLGIFKVQ